MWFYDPSYFSLSLWMQSRYVCCGCHKVYLTYIIDKIFQADSKLTSIAYKSAILLLCPFYIFKVNIYLFYIMYSLKNFSYYSIFNMLFLIVRLLIHHQIRVL